MQDTIDDIACCFSFQFYIKPQRKEMVEQKQYRCFSFQFYIKPQQSNIQIAAVVGCFSFQFYIKPQQTSARGGSRYVVSHSNSTSNHNRPAIYPLSGGLFLIPILHQTTTNLHYLCCGGGCFSFQFYIKPQPRAWQ